MKNYKIFFNIYTSLIWLFLREPVLIECPSLFHVRGAASILSGTSWWVLRALRTNHTRIRISFDVLLPALAILRQSVGRGDFVQTYYWLPVYIFARLQIVVEYVFFGDATTALAVRSLDACVWRSTATEWTLLNNRIRFLDFRFCSLGSLLVAKLSGISVFQRREVMALLNCHWVLLEICQFLDRWLTLILNRRIICLQLFLLLTLLKAFRW